MESYSLYRGFIVDVFIESVGKYMFKKIKKGRKAIKEKIKAHIQSL